MICFIYSSPCVRRKGRCLCSTCDPRRKAAGFWETLDPHITRTELQNLIALGRCYVLLCGATPVGVMRYNLLWDSVPFLTMLCLSAPCRRKGYGGAALAAWEDEMRAAGHEAVMASAQSDQGAQHFYRIKGYHDAGCLILDGTPLAQRAEHIFVKRFEPTGM